MPVPFLAAALKAVAGLVADFAAKEAAEQAARELVKEVHGQAAKLELEVSVRLDLKALGRLKGESRKAVYRAVNRAAKPVKAAVIANAEAIKKYGWLAKSIGTKTRIYRGAIITVVGPKMSFLRRKPGRPGGVSKGAQGRGPGGRFAAKVVTVKNGNDGRNIRPYLYAWLLEFGTRRFAAKGFLRKAWNQEGPGYRERLIGEIAAELAKVNGSG